ncbi:MAG: hypothetical protein SF069_08685 [Phycisphaerae bacterium]|nr:hypothetical protein [Phycisphaerae bacterium]
MKRRAASLIAAASLVAGAAAHNLVRIRGETSFDRDAIVIVTTWSDAELDAFRTSTSHDPLPSVGNVDTALAIGRSLAASLCYLRSPDFDDRRSGKTRPCARAQFVRIESICEERDSEGRVRREHGWRLTHRMAANPEETSFGSIAFLPKDGLRSHPISLLVGLRRLYDCDGQTDTAFEITPDQTACDIYLQKSSDGTRFDVCQSSPMCGMSIDDIYPEVPCDHEHAP